MPMFVLSIIEDQVHSTPLNELMAYADGTTAACDLLRRKIQAEAATAIEAARDGDGGNAGPDREQDE